MKYASIVIRVLLVLVGLMLLSAGFMWGFFPAENLQTYDIQVGSPIGMNMIKSDIGGPLMAGGVFLILAAVRQGTWIWAQLILGLGYLAVRAVSLGVDGYAPMAAFGVGLEAVVVVLLLALKWIEVRTSEADRAR